LHGAIDDATNEVPAASFRLQEDATGYFLVLRHILRTRGIPGAIYGDRHGIVTNEARLRPLTLEEQLQGRPRPLTQVGRALHELGIRWIAATSPQAKGRVERLWGTFQDRLVSELRLAKARTLPEANAVLHTFLPRYNARFSRPAPQPGSAYRPLAPALDPDAVCCFTYARIVDKDNTVVLGAQRFQLLPDPHRASYARAHVTMRRHLDGTLSISYRGRRVAFHACLPAAAPGRRPHPRKRLRRPRPTTTWKPGPDHPWQLYAAQNLRRKQLRDAGVTFSPFTEGDGIALR
jgi:hypothetical protein